MASILWPNAGKEANKLSFDEELLCSSVRSVTLLPHNVLDTILERCGQPPPQPQSTSILSRWLQLAHAWLWFRNAHLCRACANVYRMTPGTKCAESCRKNGRNSRVPFNSELGWTRIFFAAYPVDVRYRFLQTSALAPHLAKLDEPFIVPVLLFTRNLDVASKA